MAKWKLWLKFILTELHKNQQWYIQVYVALSWSTSLQGLHIILGEINKNYVKADPKVYQDYEKLRSTFGLTILPIYTFKLSASLE